MFIVLFCLYSRLNRESGSHDAYTVAHADTHGPYARKHSPTHSHTHTHTLKHTHTHSHTHTHTSAVLGALCPSQQQKQNLTGTIYRNHNQRAVCARVREDGEITSHFLLLYCPSSRLKALPAWCESLSHYQGCW